MGDINLLPKDDFENLESGKLVRRLRKVSFVLVGLLIIVGVAGTGFLYYLSRSLEAEEVRNASLKMEVVSLESTEQGLVLLKDRLEKISTLFVFRNTNDVAIKQEGLLNSMGDAFSFEELRVTADEPYVSVYSPDSFSTAELLGSLARDSKYQRVKLISLSYGKKKGYKIDLVVE